MFNPFSGRISRGQRLASVGFALAALATAHVASALPVFPGAVGFGTDTPAGRSAANNPDHIYKVTTLDDSNTTTPAFGTLRYGIEEVTGPRTIVFEVSGVIELQRDLYIRATTANPDYGYLTIAGQTAPFPGITLKNGGIRIFSHDILIQHIAIRPGKLTNQAAGWDLTPIDNRDCIRPERLAVSNLVVDHVTCSWTTDETFTTWWDDVTHSGTLTNMTVSNSIFAYPLQYSGHLQDQNDPMPGQPERHGFGMLIGPGSSNVSIVRNVMAFAWTRNPLIRHKTSGAQVINNFVYRPGPFDQSVISIGPRYDADPGFLTRVSAIGNLAYLVPPVNWNGEGITTAHQEGFWVSGNATTNLRLYLNGNYTYQPQPPVPGASVWQTTSSDPLAPYPAPYYKGNQPVERLGADPYVNSGGTTWSPILGPPAHLKWKIVPGAGKFSGQRDPIDAELMAQINDPDDDSLWLKEEADLGPNPWGPVNIVNTRAFAVPNNPTLDDDADGYTNLEEELHRWAAIVEGRSVVPDGEVSKFDTFSDGVADGWTTTNGIWSVSGSTYLQTTTDQDVRALLNGSNWTDQVVEANVDVSTFNPVGVSMVAVYARFTSINDAYYMTLRNTGVVELKRIKGGVVTTYDTFPTGTYDPLLPHVLRLEVQGNSLRGFVDNTEVVSGTDNEWGLISGQAGVGGYHANVAFDTVFASPFPPGSRLTDDFDDQNSSGWSMAETGAGAWSTAAVSAGSGNWILQQNLATGNQRASRAVTGRDQSTQAKVQFTGAPGSTAFIAVYARYVNVNNAYYALLRHSRVLELKKVVNGVSSTIATLNLPANFDLTAWHTLRVDVSGDELTTLKAHLDGQLQLVGSDVVSPFTAPGSAAVGTSATSAKFDDIVLQP